MNALQKIIAMIVAVIVMFMASSLYFELKKDSIVQLNVDKETTEFVETITTQGYITRNMYERYLKGLNATGKLFDVKLIREQNAFEPEYKLRTAGEVVDEDEKAWLGVNDYHAQTVTTETPVVFDPINTEPTNSETNASILAAAVNTPASAGHVHTASCYTGHIHTSSADCHFVHNHAHNGSCAKYLQQQITFQKCANCSLQYCSMAVYWRWDSAYGQTVLVGAYPTYQCPNCNSSTTVAGATITKNSYCYSCGYDKDIDGDGYNDDSGFTQQEYIRDYPQGVATKATYSVGCYTYHVHGIVDNYPEGTTYKASNHKYYDAYIRDPLLYISNSGCLQNFCYVPQDYSFQLESEDGNSCEYVTYRAEILADGTERFVFSSAGPYYLIASSEYSRLPQILTLTQLRELITPSGFCYYIEKYLGKSYSRISSFNMSMTYSGGIDLCTITTANSWYLTCGKEENGKLACGEKVVSITPTHPIQTVATGDPLITTVSAMYQDGSTKTIACTTSFTTNSVCQNQTVTLTYTYIIDGLSYSQTCTITVNVIPRNKICSNGHTYNLNANGSDPGCPYCRSWLTRLLVYVPSSGKLTLYRNPLGSLKTERVGLLAIYMDGHTELVYTDYVDNLDPDYVGTQTVTIGYKGLTTTLQVTVLRNRKKCDVCGLYYNLHLDDSDSGCPYCKARVPVFTGNVLKYCKGTYEEEIITELYEGEGIYYFRRGDNFMVRVESSAKSKGLIGKMFELKIRAYSADTIKDEESFVDD